MKSTSPSKTTKSAEYQRVSPTRFTFEARNLGHFMLGVSLSVAARYQKPGTSIKEVKQGKKVGWRCCSSQLIPSGHCGKERKDN